LLADNANAPDRNTLWCYQQRLGVDGVTALFQAVDGQLLQRGYDFARCHAHLKLQGIQDRIARKGIERNDRLGRNRWVVERTHAWLAAFGKLRVRFERRIDSHLGLLCACVGAS